MIKSFLNRGFIGLLMTFVFAASAHFVYADRDDFEDFLESRQQEVVASFNQLHTRVKALNSNSPKKSQANDLLDDAESAVDAFSDLDANDHIVDLGNDVFDADQTFKDAEEEAISSINAVNQFLIAPFRPGGKTVDENGDEVDGTVPEGDLIEDFIPQFIRLLFRFTSIAILISMVVSAIMLIAALDNEENHNKARNMLIFSIVGFAFVALAFAIVRAVTTIDFFIF